MTNYSLSFARVCALLALLIGVVAAFHVIPALAMPGVVIACVILLALALLLPF